MNGLKEDLLNGVVSDIEKEWKSKGGNISYFVRMVKERTALTPKDLDRYLAEHGETCHEGVNRVFATIVYEDFLENTEGGTK